MTQPREVAAQRRVRIAAILAPEENVCEHVQAVVIVRADDVRHLEGRTNALAIAPRAGRRHALRFARALVEAADRTAL